MFRRRLGLRMPPRKLRWRRKERREVEGRKRRPRRPASPQRGAGRQRGRPGRPSRGGSRPKHRGRSVRHEKRRAEKSQEKRQGSRQGNLPENPRGKRQESRQGKWAGGRLGRSRGLRAAVDQDLSCVRTPMRRRNAAVEMGIRADRYKAMVPQVVGEVRLKSRVHASEAKLARAHTKKKLKITMPGPMTIIDTIADQFYGDRIKMAFAFAGLLNEEARALQD